MQRVILRSVYRSVSVHASCSVTFPLPVVKDQRQKILGRTFSQITNLLPLQQHISEEPIGHPVTMKIISLSVDGNISSGKSTLVSKLMELLPKNGLVSFNGGSSEMGLHVEVIPEPLEKWCNVEGHNLLEMFYKNPEKYNFIFEHYVQLTRLMDTIQNTGDGTQESGPKDSSREALHLRIMERSLQNNRYCFMELAKKKGTLHPAECAVMDEWYKWWEGHVDINLDLLIYLQTEPKTAYDRMKRRARAAEDLCPYDYLVDLHEAYEEWLIRNPAMRKKTHVIVLDANKSQNEVAAECIQKLNEYLHTLTSTKKIEHTAPSSEYCTTA